MAILSRPPFASQFAPDDVAVFLDRIEIVGDCWEWQRYIQPNGYGHCRRKSWRPDIYVHRIAYRLWHGDIPEGMEIDHRCNNRRCCNPDHLIATTHKANVLRGDAPTAINARRTHCQRGHAFDAENTLIVQGKRLCRACREVSNRRYEEAHSERHRTRRHRKRPGMPPVPAS